MALSGDVILFGVALFALLVAVIFIMLRISNSVIAKKLNILADKVMEHDAMLAKFTRMVAETKKEVKHVKGSVEKEDRRIHDLKAEVEIKRALEEKMDREAMQKAIAVIGKK